MKRTVAVVAALLLLAGCRKPEQAATAPAPETGSPEQYVPQIFELEKRNLLNIVDGTTVVSRTAELTLEQSALRTIDGEWDSNWSQPADDPVQSIVYAFPGVATISEVGATTTTRRSYAAKKIEFATSMDGAAWQTLVTIDMKPVGAPQLAKVAPRTARFLRLTTVEAYGSYASLYSVFAFGSLARVAQGDLAGCWEINGLQAQFNRAGARITGYLAGTHPLFVDGGTDGRTCQLAWSSGPQHGLAAVMVSPDGAHLSGLKWHEVADPLQIGETWFGKRVACGAPPSSKPEPVALVWLQKTGGFPLLGLRFDDSDRLIENESAAALEEVGAIVNLSRQRLALVAHEFRDPSEEKNRARTKKRIDSLRAALAKRGVDVAKLDFVAAGGEQPQARMPSRLLQSIYSSVEIRVVGRR